MRLFTDLPESEISGWEKVEGAKINDAKKRLADVATAMLHGEEESQKAASAAEAVFKGGSSEHMPTFEVPRAQLAAGLPIADALVLTKLADSKGDARRQIRAGAVKLNGEPANNEQLVLVEESLEDADSLRLSMGKKRHARLKAV
jgi:tyrosyl-tRNA synthetase